MPRTQALLTSRPMQVRPADPKDAATLAAANVALARESEGLALDPARAAEGARAVLADPTRGRYFVAESGSELLGQLLITPEWSDWRAVWTWWIQSVYVAPPHRGRGVYRALHQHVVDEARRHGVFCLKLYVDRDNERAMEAYRAVGMRASHYELWEQELA